MAVADLDYVELLDDPVVEASLVPLELVEQFAAKIDRQHVQQATRIFDLRLTRRDLISHGADIALIFEEGCHSFLSGV